MVFLRDWSLAKVILAAFHAIFRHGLSEFGEFFSSFFGKFALIRIKIKKTLFAESFFSRVKLLLFALALIAIPILSLNRYYMPFFREHKPLRYETNPGYWVYSVFDLILKNFDTNDLPIKSIGLDATMQTESKPRLLIVVVGEAARADHFSLNGYAKLTNPLLSKQSVLNFPDLYSCGTSTAHSVPCMFSPLRREEFSNKKAKSMENILDLLKHTGKVKILWRDNNSNSKGVALRVAYEDFKTSEKNHICDTECRDIGMLDGLDELLKDADSHVLIVLHQMGNHGPAYYKRYPKEFERFKPVCETNQLEECTKEQISNAYDNAILYTDYFLNKTIEFLKAQEGRYKTALIYMSDHGESLGEHGLYLHGMPYFMAPDEQKHISGFVWLGDSLRQSSKYTAAMQNKNKKLGHDYLFHSILGIFDVNSTLYDPKLDIFYAP